MFRTFFAAALTTGLLASTAPVFAQTLVKEVEVTADLTAVQNAKAGEYWAGLAEDLKGAIVAKLADQISEDGAKVTVEINSVELANSLQSAAGTAESKLVGTVKITHDTDNSKFKAYDLTVTYEQAGPFFLPGTDLAAITTDSKEYYDGMIAAFADSVEKSLQ